ncbi:LysR family transcriptional regulator [Ruminococcaceae bacterium OttesenSCG-928-L11]|nr:LysR family transcriptional regulator [Ruminococcaceae bacterium OttesenSCG-928-L11]
MGEHNHTGTEWSVRIRLRRGGELVFGTGVSRLLHLTDQLGSLHRAAKEMGMSYRKALQIVKRAEASLGQPLLTRSVGGDGGGGSQLTPFAREYVDQFQALQQQVEAYAVTLAKTRYPGLLQQDFGSET